MKERRIYISGPMRGIEGHNAGAFNEAATRFRRDGWEVVNPVEIAQEFGGEEEVEGDWRKRMAVMEKELGLVATCGAIYMLVGWEKSEGAKLELQNALVWGLEVKLQGGGK